MAQHVEQAQKNGTGPGGASPAWWVVCLCAAWCGVCRDYRLAWNALTQQHPELRVVWVDVEDQAELVGDLDIETFPTVLIADGSQARFLGPVLPQVRGVERLLQSLQEGGAASVAGLSEADALFQRLRTGLV